MPLGNILLSARVSSLLGLESAERRGVASYEQELAVQRATESELRKALARDQTLLRQKDDLIRHQKMLTEECHHRLLNNLQMIVALVSLQSLKEANPETASRLSIAADRVRAIAGLHHHLHSMDGRPTVEFKPYLDLLCRDHSTMSMSDERPDQVIAVDAIELKLGELVLVLRDDFADLVPNRAWIDLDVIMRHRQLSQECLGDFTIGWNNDLAVLGVDDVERNFFAEQDIRKRVGQLFDERLFLALMFFTNGFELPSGFRRGEFFARNFAAGRDLYVHHNPIGA